MKSLKIFIVLFIFILTASCSSDTPKETVIEKVGEFIDCVYDGNSEQYKKCLAEQEVFLLQQIKNE